MSHVFSFHNDTNDLLDRGLHYGDGFFTTMLVLDCQIINWSAHWQRIAYSANKMQFKIESEATIKSWIEQSFKQYNQSFNVAKIIITRGVGGKGYQPLHVSKANYYLYLINAKKTLKKPISPQKVPKGVSYLAEKGLKVGISEVKWGVQPLLSGIKHLNRLENVMAQQALLATDFDECVMLDIEGKVVSATAASLCLIDGNRVISPSITTSGITSTSLVLLGKMLQEQGKELVFKTIRLVDLEKAEEMFFCNAIKGIMPVADLEGKIKNTARASQLSEQFMHYQYETLNDETTK